MLATFHSQVLSADALTVQFEEDVYELLLDWVYYDFERRKQYFGLLFEALRLPYIPYTYVQNIIKKEELVRNNPVSYGAVVQYEKLAAKLAKGVSIRSRANFEKLVGGPRTNYKDMCIFVCGGKGTEGLCELYNPATNSWRNLEDMPVGRSNAAVFKVSDDEICFVGGEDKLKEVVNPTVCYKFSQEEWTDGIVIPGQIRSGARCATLAGKTYLIGGIASDEGYTNSVERFNPDGHRWVPVKSMDYKRFSFGCATLDGFVYACGGFDGEQDLRECEFFMPDCNEWTGLAPMNVPRSGCKTVAAEGKLYTLGGWNGTEILDSCEVYDPRSNRWNMIEPMNRARHGLDVVVIGNVIYAIGGWNGRKQLSSIERYHTRSGTWELVRPMSVGRWLTTAIPIPADIHSHT